MNPAPAGRPRGWNASERALLAAIAAALAIALGWSAWGTTEAEGLLPAPELVVDPNTAPPEVLLALPRVGPTLVKAIVAARREAPFESLADFDARVRGVGPATLAALKPHLRIEPALPRATPRTP
jgi:competence protein ComEA